MSKREIFVKLEYLLNTRKAYLKEPVIQFAYNHVAPDLSIKLHSVRLQKGSSPFEQLMSIASEYQANWENAEIELKKYKTLILEKKMDKNQVVTDIAEFQKIELLKQDHIKQTIQEEIEQLNKDDLKIINTGISEIQELYKIYIGHIKNIIEPILIYEPDEFFAIILNEIDNTLYWIAKTQVISVELFNSAVDKQVKSLIESIGSQGLNLCNRLKSKLSGLDKTFIKKRRNAKKIKTKREEDVLLNAISEVKAKKRCAINLVKLEKTFLHLQTELNAEYDTLNYFNSQLRSEIQRATTDTILKEVEKLSLVNNLKEKYSLMISECENKIDEMNITMDDLKNSLWDEIRRLSESRSIQFQYDEFGRFFINDFGQKIYKEDDTDSEYIQDEYGTFIKVDSTLDIENKYVVVKIDDSDYLKSTVGQPLVKALAQMIMYQPSDPIQYLGLWLLKYKNNIDNQLNKELKRTELNEEREKNILENRSIHSEKRETSPRHDIWQGEESYPDHNMASYQTQFDRKSL